MLLVGPEENSKLLPVAKMHWMGLESNRKWWGVRCRLISGAAGFPGVEALAAGHFVSLSEAGRCAGCEAGHSAGPTGIIAAS